MMKQNTARDEALRISALENALDILSQQLVDANRIIAQLCRLPSDPPQSEPSAADADKKGRGAADPVIDAAIDRLGTREVSPPDRGKLRKALDKAEAPPSGRDAANQALGRISRG